MDKYLLIDNGGTQIKYALAYEDGSIIENDYFDTPSKKLPNAFDLYFEGIDRVVDKYKDQDIKGVAISCPGRIDDDGVCLDAGALPYFINKNFVEEFKNRYDFKASIENDAKCAALAELVSGSLKGCKNGMVITIGTGLGGGIISNGKLYKGSNYCSGEISVIPMDMYNFYDEKNNACALISTKSLIAMVANALELDSQNMNGKDAFEYINNEDPRALNALEKFCDYVGQLIYSIQIILDCEAYAIGGGISAQPKLIEYIDKSTQKAFSVPWICEPGGQPAVVRPRVVACKYMNDANLLGALYDFLNKYKGEQQ